ncbi:hypothetical protein CANCADRAFT_100252 [Tortispora caseinolytica NRRL Y-17796]|uniref:Uncharacterized protein n=1 Tax=Tortispora caseinolytica NRRL Y-17796 TaxID=767744 RepID=A0A1E4TE62_9ASCO|nr:hypothetical protein CANCADRAFT_100252 [Tortispora caseinolytica NRRL Y-17796]
MNDSCDGDLYVRNLAAFIRSHERQLANALSMYRKTVVSNKSNTAANAKPNANAPQPLLSASASSIKASRLSLTTHHLFYLLHRFEEIRLYVGPMDIRTESSTNEDLHMNYISFLQHPTRKVQSDTMSIRSVSSVKSVISGVSSIWSRVLNSSATQESKRDRFQAAVNHDLKYIYSAFTKLPCLRIAPDSRARLIRDHEEYPFDTAVPLVVFKNVTALEIMDFDMQAFYGWAVLADQLRFLVARRINIQDPSDLLVTSVCGESTESRKRSRSSTLNTTCSQAIYASRRQDSHADTFYEGSPGDTTAEALKVHSASSSYHSLHQPSALHSHVHGLHPQAQYPHYSHHGSPGYREYRNSNARDVSPQYNHSNSIQSSGQGSREPQIATHHGDHLSSVTVQRHNSRSSIDGRVNGPARANSLTSTIASSTSRSSTLNRSNSASSASSSASVPQSGNSRALSSVASNFEITKPGKSNPAVPRSKWRYLKHLSLADNGFATITDESFHPVCETLTSLDLSSNVFLDIPVKSISVLSELRTLNISRNKITDISNLKELDLPHLSVLNLRGNNLSTLYGIENLQGLERVDLRDNNISDIAELQRLCSCSSISEIWVSGNPFTIISGNPYRITIFNYFRQAKGFEDDIKIDDSKPGMLELRQLVSRVAVTTPNSPPPPVYRLDDPADNEDRSSMAGKPSDPDSSTDGGDELGAPVTPDTKDLVAAAALLQLKDHEHERSLSERRNIDLSLSIAVTDKAENLNLNSSCISTAVPVSPAATITSSTSKRKSKRIIEFPLSDPVDDSCVAVEAPTTPQAISTM